MDILVIVPFRDDKEHNRQKQLNKFIPHMEKFFLGIEEIEEVDIFVITQSDDDRKFNRGKLINCCLDDIFKESKINQYDSYIIHDVDLLPTPEMAPYYIDIPKNKVVHIASGGWDRYESNTFLGGITAFSKNHLIKIDGFPNIFWGWGGEDDEVYRRLKYKKIGIKKLPYIEGGFIDQENMNLEEKLDFLRKNTKLKCTVKKELLNILNKNRKKCLKWWGLRNVNYTILDEDILYNTSFLMVHQITVKLGRNKNFDGTIFVDPERDFIQKDRKSSGKRKIAKRRGFGFKKKESESPKNETYEPKGLFKLAMRPKPKTNYKKKKNPNELRWSSPHKKSW